MLLREEVCLTSWYLGARNGSAAKPLISRQRISPGPARAQSRRLPQHLIALASLIASINLSAALHGLLRGPPPDRRRASCMLVCLQQCKPSWTGPSGGRYS